MSSIERILQRASSAHRNGRLKDAERVYKKALKKDPGSPPILNALGTVLLDQGRPRKARALFLAAGSSVPPYIPALYNLARVEQIMGHTLKAVEAYEQIISIEPGFTQAWNNLGSLYLDNGEPEKALRCLNQAVKVSPDMAEAWNNLGVAQEENELFDLAISSYERAVSLHGRYFSALYNLGSLLMRMGRRKEARDYLEKALRIKPKDSSTTFLLQSLGVLPSPSRVPISHVRKIFDECAKKFEETLIKRLRYSTPERLFRLVEPQLHGKARLDILDLGCGTGLGADLYRPYARTLTGVDASPGMLEIAEQKGIFDRLYCMDIEEPWGFDHPFDLIYSSDVFVYLGNLDRLFGHIAAHVRPGGIMAFSVEELKDENQGFRLLETGRYAHSMSYINDTLQAHGFTPIRCISCILREESGSPVDGLLITAVARNR